MYSNVVTAIDKILRSYYVSTSWLTLSLTSFLWVVTWTNLVSKAQVFGLSGYWEPASNQEKLNFEQGADALDAHHAFFVNHFIDNHAHEFIGGQ